MDSADAMHRLFGLVLAIFDERDEDRILRLAGESINSVGSCRLAACYVVTGGVLSPVGEENHREIQAQVETLRGAAGMITVRGHKWCRAFPVWHDGRQHGCLVIRAATEPDRQELRLLALLVEQTTLALANASAHRRDREEIRRLREEQDRLANAVTGMKRLHHSLYSAFAAGAGERGIAKALHQVTGLPTAVEDHFGNPMAWAGPGRPDPYPKPSRQQRQELLREVTRRGPVARVKDRLIAVADPGDDMLGVLVLVDPDRRAGQHELLALEQGAMVLTGELARQHDLSQLERRLGRGLADDLLAGDGGDRLYERARAIDHDLHGTHQVVAIQWTGTSAGILAMAAEHAAASLGVSSLTSTRDGTTILLADDRLDGHALHEAIAKRLRTGVGAIGIGDPCDSPEELPRSFREALLALDVRTTAQTPHGATSFGDLGILRVLDTGDGGAKIRRFVRDWLGPLVDYDTRHGSDLVHTLSRHLECGGNYDDTAAALMIHRSTLRYRLQRIREISGLDIADVGNRLNLHVATKAWQIIS
jgi:sugar diacid utilization regulator